MDMGLGTSTSRKTVSTFTSAIVATGWMIGLLIITAAYVPQLERVFEKVLF